MRKSRVDCDYLDSSSSGLPQRCTDAYEFLAGTTYYEHLDRDSGGTPNAMKAYSAGHLELTDIHPVTPFLVFCALSPVNPLYFIACTSINSDARCPFRAVHG